MTSLPLRSLLASSPYHHCLLPSSHIETAKTIGSLSRLILGWG
jgi:hypothetical protein